MSEETPLHDMNPLNRFSDRAMDYAKYRPSYPDEAISCILTGLGEQLVAADIGAGTGIASRLLAQKGIQVIAIEPNAAMRDAATPHELVAFQEGSAEATNLPHTSVDLVTCFQSFHWFNPIPTLGEFRRILKANGRLAVVWNDVEKNVDEFTRSYTHLVKIASNNHPAESRMVSVEPLLNSLLFPNIRYHQFTYQQGLDLEGLIGRTMSESSMPKEGELHQQLISGLTELYNRSCDENGLVYMAYCTSVYLS